MSEQVIDRATLEKKDKGELTTIVNALGGKATSRMKKSDLIDLIIEHSGAVVAASDAKAEAEGTTGDGTLSEQTGETASSGADSSSSGGGNRGVSNDRDGSGDSASETRAPRQAGGRGTSSRDTTPRETTSRDTTARETTARETTARETTPAGRSGNDKSRTGGDDRNQSPGNDRGSGNGRNQGGNQGGGRSQTADRSQNDGSKADRSGDDSSQAESQKGQSGSAAGSSQSNAGQSGGQGGGGQSGGGQSGGQGQQPKADDTENGNRRRRRRGRGRDRDDMIEPVTNESVDVAGILDLRDDGYGFIRVDGLLPSKDDVYVPVKLVRQFGLRRGDLVTGSARPANRNEKNPALADVESVNGRSADETSERPEFDRLTAVFPDQPLHLERTDEPGAVTPRILDLVAPIGLGQRMLVVAPPKAGKTTLIKEMARSIEVNHPDAELVVLLIDERPEDVTDMASHLEHGDVVASTFDRPSDEHCSVAELTLERAKRMVEAGADVVIILDGITHLARAYNMAGSSTGRTLAGGLDAGAIYPTKHFFGSARKIDEGGSLTIIATVAVETGSAMDDAIYGEFDGTANAEVRLDRLIAERNIFPAIDVANSGTRNDHLLLDEVAKPLVDRLHLALADLVSGDNGHGASAAAMLSERVAQSATNEEFLNEFA